MGWVKLALGFLGGLVRFFNKRADSEQQAHDEETGATAQRESSQKAVLKAKDKQLEVAANADDDAMMKALKDGDF